MEFQISQAVRIAHIAQYVRHNCVCCIYWAIFVIWRFAEQETLTLYISCSEAKSINSMFKLFVDLESKYFIEVVVRFFYWKFLFK